MNIITDEEILERTNGDVLFVDMLDRKIETQKISINGRDRAAVETALALNHEQR